MPKYILTIHGRSFRVATHNDARHALVKRYPEARVEHAPHDTVLRLDGLGIAAFEAAYFGPAPHRVPSPQTWAFRKHR